MTRYLSGIGVAAAVAVLALTGSAEAAIVDFEDLSVPFNTQINPPPGVGVVSQGFNYTPGPNNASGFNDLHISNQQAFWSFNGTTIGGTHDDVVLTQVGGGPFSIQQFDFAGMPTNAEVPFNAVGQFQGGGNIVARFLPDGLVDGPGGVVDFQTFYFSAAWNNLVSVTFNHTGGGTQQGLFALDNIVVNEVPEPSTLLLFGAALVALRVRRRNQ